MLGTKQDKILIIDDDPGMVTLVQGITGFGSTQVYSAGDLEQGFRLASSRRFDVILLDHSLPDGEGLDIIEQLLLQDRLRPILYITAQSSSDTAIEAIKRGAYEYISKPIDFQLLRDRLTEAIEYRQLTRLPVLVDSELSVYSQKDVLVGRCRSMQDVYKAIGRLAALDTPVLIEGEVGTGKEMIARAIHQHSAFHDTPFHVVRSDELGNPSVDAQIFGDSQSVHGTILIEDIGNVSNAYQLRLFKRLQERASIQSLHVGDRLIFSSTEAGGELVERKRLRSDLFYFLSPYTVRVPALRDRQEDLELLVAHFMQELVRVSALDQKQGPPRVSATALTLLKSFDWPGNVAQLKSVLQSILMESRGAVLATDALSRAIETPSHRKESPNPEPIFTDNKVEFGSNETLLDIAAFVQTEVSANTTNLYDAALLKLDWHLLNQVLAITQGNQAQAARILGMTRTSLRKKIQACRIDPFHFNQSKNNDSLSTPSQPLKRRDGLSIDSANANVEDEQ